MKGFTSLISLMQLFLLVIAADWAYTSEKVLVIPKGSQASFWQTVGEGA